MRVKDLSGKDHAWPLGKYVGKINNNASSLHVRVREFLAAYYPALQVIEEVYAPGEKLFLDLYIPTLKIAIEVQSALHDKFVPHFHGNKLNFYKAQARDKRKKDWCELNNITLVEFFPNEDEIAWKTKLETI